MIDKSGKIFVAGHLGLVGSAIWRNLSGKGYTNLVGCSRSELDLLDAVAVKNYFDKIEPDYVILAAAHVGGIQANNKYRADFIWNNLQIQQNVIRECYTHKVKKLLFLGSTCVYPRQAPQPMVEEALLTSPLEYTNEPYAIAKIAGLKICESFNIQYGTNFIAVMPTNLYGPNDNFDLERSHVLPAIMRKIHLSKCLANGNWQSVRLDLAARPVEGIEVSSSESTILGVLEKYGIRADSVTLWGTGVPLREFLWSNDMADACVHIMERVNFSDLKAYAESHGAPRGEIRNCHINIGTGKELSIATLASKIAREAGFKGEILFDPSKPDGTMRKLTDPGKLNALGWSYKVDIDQGIHRLYEWYLDNQ